MNSRERFLATMLFGTPDRIPYHFGGPRESTFNAWYKQGLPREINWSKFVGFDHWEGLPINLGPVPPFQEVVLEETDLSSTLFGIGVEDKHRQSVILRTGNSVSLAGKIGRLS